jgi:hypothetical protein
MRYACGMQIVRNTLSKCMEWYICMLVVSVSYPSIGMPRDEGK